LLIAETGPVTDRLRVREIDDDEGRRLVRIVRRYSGSVTWRRTEPVHRARDPIASPAIGDNVRESACLGWTFSLERADFITDNGSLSEVTRAYL
jgi:hypothetical protein